MNDLLDLLGPYKLVLGLEIHLHLNTAEKMFCGCDARFYNDEPNTHTCPVCLGLPGALPVPNKEAVEKTQLLGLALHSFINLHSKFDRKHYFYPDLPKGYQISQYKEPLCSGGYVDLLSGFRAMLERIHLEEDTAKSLHEGNKTLIDFNKSGMPLVEIVTKPVFTDTASAVAFCKYIQDVVRYLGIGEANMEKGQMRLEANISLRTAEMEKAGQLPSYKVEVKNINSFRFMERAVRAEIKRQRAVLESGGTVLQENRGWSEALGETVSQRSKEEAHDYRYFPEPDIPPMVFTSECVDGLRARLPELPDARLARLLKLGVSTQVAGTLAGGDNLDLVAKLDALTARGLDGKLVANMLATRKDLGKKTVDELYAELRAGKHATGISESELSEIVTRVLVANSKAVLDYKAGKAQSLEFLVGQVMREIRGKADNFIVREDIISALAGI